MGWGGIKPDKLQRLPGGVKISEYLLKNHGYKVPDKRSQSIQGVTIMPVPVHLLEECNPVTRFGWVVESSDDLATLNIAELKPDGQIPHYIVTLHSEWQILDNADCWQRSNGTANNTTLGVAITMDDGLLSSQYKRTALNRAEMLVAYLLKKNRLTVKNIYITKDCPEFFTSRWKDFKQAVQAQLKKL